MQLSTENVENVTIVLVPGETLDASNAKDFKSIVAPLLIPGAKIVFDLARLKFVDSSGLGAMLSCLRQLNGMGGDLKLCALAKPIRALFELVRMHRVFEIFNAREDAVRSFGIDMPVAAERVQA